MQYDVKQGYTHTLQGNTLLFCKNRIDLLIILQNVKKTHLHLQHIMVRCIQ